MKVKPVFCEAVTIALLTIAYAKAQTNSVFNINHVLLMLNVVVHFLRRVEKFVLQIQLIPRGLLP